MDGFLGRRPASMFVQAHVFAVERSVYPLFHQSGDLEKSRRSLYEIGEVVVESIALRLSALQREGRRATFYEVERDLRHTRPRLDRSSHIAVCRYLYLSGFLSSEFWNHYCERGESPYEAESIITTCLY